MLIERIFLTGHTHPREYERAAAGDYVHFPLVLFYLLYGLAGNAAVKRHEIDTVLRVQSHHIDEVLRRESRKVTLIVDNAVIHRHSADHSLAFGSELASERLCVAVRGKIHYRFRTHFDSGVDLLHLDIVVLAVTGYAEVDVYLRAKHGAHAVRFDAGMELIGADSYLSFRDKIAYLLRCAVLLFGYRFHFGRDDSFTRRVHLCCVVSHSVVPFGIYFSTAKRELRSKAWFMGPEPCPRSSIAARAPEMYSFARLTDSQRPNPFARLAAIALESVQPVPWVLGLSMRLPSNHCVSPSE